MPSASAFRTSWTVISAGFSGSCGPRASGSLMVMSERDARGPQDNDASHVMLFRTARIKPLSPQSGETAARAHDHEAINSMLFGRVLAQDTLQGAAVHVEPARGFRDVAVALLEDPLNVFPAHPVGRHRVGGRRRQLAAMRVQRLL